MKIGRFSQAIGIVLLFVSTSVFSAEKDEDLSQAKSYLKEHLQGINRKYPFADWDKRLKKARGVFETLRNRQAVSGTGFDKSHQSRLGELEREARELSRLRNETGNLIQELRAASLADGVEAIFLRKGKSWNAEGKSAFRNLLAPYEPGSIKPKTAFQAEVTALERDIRALQSGWQFTFAQDYLSRRVEHHLREFELAKIEGLYDDFALQLDYWNRQIQANPAQTRDQLRKLSERYQANGNWLRQNLESLLEVLNTDMLFSDLLEHASKQKVEFTIEVEEKIESSLKERSRATLSPIQTRLGLWREFASALGESAARAESQAESHQNQVYAQAEYERLERERLEALKAEQRRMELEQKEKFKETLSALKTFTFKGETSVELDADSKKALSTKAGFLKTSYVRSGSRKLKVDKERFNDTLAMVEKFTVKEGQVDFSKMSLQERSNQSAYTYASPAGRTSQGDLENFVAEVALGSFSTHFNFLSYVTPSRWTPGKSFSWIAERAGEKEAKDREFSYVDLVVDAHKKRSPKSARSESGVNLPANMLIVFDPQGAIIRFQSFADVDEARIGNGDLVGGKLYYKFLNYSADRQHIYLNGIDGEMKVATPAGKS